MALQAASEFDPAFDATRYDARRRAAVDFSSNNPNTAGGNITSLNTAIGHLDHYKQAVHALGNWNIPLVGGLLNEAANAALQSSDPRIKAVDDAQTALAEELTRAFRGSGGSVSDIENWRKNLDRNAGEAVQQGSADEAVRLMASRIRNLRQSYIATVGRPPDMQFLRPDSRKILQKLGYDPDAVESGEFGAAGGVGTAAIPRLTNDAAGQAAYAKLPSGAVFIDSDGNQRTKR
jgi:hypothetical protein